MTVEIPKQKKGAGKLVNKGVKVSRGDTFGWRQIDAAHRDRFVSLNSSRGVIRDEALADLGEAELIRTLKSQAVTHAKVFKTARIQKGDKGVEVTNPFSVLEDMEVVTNEDRPLPPSPLVSPSKTSAVT
nr:hypothetical protein BaRGS_009195 [Batillaria attramentaria]